MKKYISIPLILLSSFGAVAQNESAGVTKQVLPSSITRGVKDINGTGPELIDDQESVPSEEMQDSEDDDEFYDIPQMTVEPLPVEKMSKLQALMARVGIRVILAYVAAKQAVINGWNYAKELVKYEPAA